MDGVCGAGVGQLVAIGAGYRRQLLTAVRRQCGKHILDAGLGLGGGGNAQDLTMAIGEGCGNRVTPPNQIAAVGNLAAGRAIAAALRTALATRSWPLRGARL